MVGAVTAVADAHRGARVEAVADAATGGGEQEDAVVGDDPQHQDEDQRLHLLGQHQVGLAAEPGDDADRDHVGRAGGRQRDHRGEQRPLPDADDEQDQQQRADRDGRQRVEDRAGLLDARRHDAGDPDRTVVGRADVGGDQVVGDGDPALERQRRVEEQVGDRGGRLLVPHRHRAVDVDDRDGAEQAAAGGGAVGRDALRAIGDPRQRGCRQAGRIALHHRDLGQQRVAEELGRALLRGDGGGVLLDESAGVARDVGERRQEQHGADRRRDPGQHDRVPQPDDGRCKRPCSPRFLFDACVHPGTRFLPLGWRRSAPLRTPRWAVDPNRRQRRGRLVDGRSTLARSSKHGVLGNPAD